MLTALCISWGANEQTSGSCAGRWLITRAVRWFNRGRKLLTMPTGQVRHDWVWKTTQDNTGTGCTQRRRRAAWIPRTHSIYFDFTVFFYLYFTINDGSDSEPACTISGPETEAAKWHSVICNSIIYSCTFPAVTRQNGFCAKVIRWSSSTHGAGKH